MTKLYVNAMAGLLVAMVAVPVFADRAQDELEENLSVGFGESDVITDTTPPKPYVPFRYRNSLPRFQWLLDKYGWTTNQLIDGLICVITNNVVEENWSVRRKERAARMAAKQLSEIPLPVVTNFFRQFNDKDDTSKLKGITLPAMLYRTNLEPEVMAYMRSLCVRTNVSCNVGFDVVYIMFETLKTMPDEMKPAATNRVAQYIYFSIMHTTRSIAWQDRELAKIIPAYSNSIQRLLALRYVEASIANPRIKEWAHKEVESLSSIPTNKLNNISWIAEDVTGGK